MGLASGRYEFFQQNHLQEEATLVKAEAKLKDMKLKLAIAEEKHAANIPSPTERLASGKIVFVDDFSEKQPALWEIVGNDFKYQDGRLSITTASMEKTFLRSKVNHPHDFELSLSFRTTGGVKWKSVGIRFDVDQREELCHFVYMSVADGGAVHLAQTVEGVDHYTNVVSCYRSN